MSRDPQSIMERNRRIIELDHYDDDFVDVTVISHLMTPNFVRQPQHNAPFNGDDYVRFLLNGNPRTIKNQLRMDVNTYIGLVKEIVTRNVIEWDHMRLSIEESLAMFLYICGQKSSQRNVGDRFQHSSQTINRHCILMMRALGNLAPFIILPPNMAETPPEILHDQRFYPWFKDCVGAIDGTHIAALAPSSTQMPFRGRKDSTTQNVMAACSFDMKFTFVYAGWEGSAHDSRILEHALMDPTLDFPHPPPNKYFLVDAGYTNMPGFLAPYRAQPYHLGEFNTHRHYNGPKELFNHRHSSLRNVIERCFGVLKSRFPLLKHMPRYDLARQGPIVMACCVVHNWIAMQQGMDDDIAELDDASTEDGATGQGVAEEYQNQVRMSRQQLAQMAQWRDELATTMWGAYNTT